jgi:pentose-5-phosphate-3-epimerase
MKKLIESVQTVTRHHNLIRPESVPDSILHVTDTCVKPGKCKTRNIRDHLSIASFDEIVLMSKAIEKRAQKFRGKCLERLLEIVRHYDGPARHKLIDAIIKAYDKFEEFGPDFI